MSKRTNQSIQAAEQSALPGDSKGSRNFNKFPMKGPHNPNVGTSGSGPAPRPQSSGSKLISSSAHTAGVQAGIARVKNSPSASTSKGQSHLPVQSNAMRNLTNTSQPVQYGAQMATTTGGGARTGGRNQGWPNGSMYTDGAKKGSSGKDSGPVATRKPQRKGKGANFFGEYV